MPMNQSVTEVIMYCIIVNEDKIYVNVLHRQDKTFIGCRMGVDGVDEGGRNKNEVKSTKNSSILLRLNGSNLYCNKFLSYRVLIFNVLQSIEFSMNDNNEVTDYLILLSFPFDTLKKKSFMLFFFHFFFVLFNSQHPLNNRFSLLDRVKDNNNSA